MTKMAELLVYNTDTWMDRLTSGDFNKYRRQYSNWEQKYAARNMAGDVIEIREDGGFTGPQGAGYNKSVFRLVLVPGVPAATLKFLLESDPYHKRIRSIAGAPATIDGIDNLNAVIVNKP